MLPGDYSPVRAAVLRPIALAGAPAIGRRQWWWCFL